MSSDSGQYEAYTVVAAIWNIYVVITTVLFLAQNRKDFIRKRNISCCMLQVISGIAMGNSCLARMNFWPVIASNFPWLLIVIINYTMFFNWMLSYFLRTIILLNDWYTNRIGSIVQRKMDLDKVEELVEQLKPSRAELLLLNFQKKLSVEDTNLPSENAYLKYDRARILEIRLGVKRGIGSRQVLKCLGVFACFEVVLILIVLAYSGGFTSKAFDPSISQNGKDGLPVVVFVVLFLLADGYFLYLMRNIHDSIYMKLEQTTALILFYPIFAIFLASYALRPWFGHVIFIIALITINHTVSITIPALYAFFRGGHENIHVEQSMESFQRVLNDRDMFQRFKIILAEDFSIENALFLEEYNTLAPNTTSKTTQTILDAEGTRKHIEYIVNNFIISGSPHELNLSSKTRKAIISEAKKDNYTIDILETARKEVTQLMYLNSFPRFIKRMSVASSVTGTKTSTVH